MTRPGTHRRTAGMPDGVGTPGISIDRNPGVIALWVARSYVIFEVGGGGSNVLLNLGEPVEVLWFREGRAATETEIIAGIESGLPTLRAAARTDGAVAVRDLEQQIEAAWRLVS